MRHTVETLIDKSLVEFRVLCQLKNGKFACFDLPKNENMLIAELGEIHSYMKYVKSGTKTVFIPIPTFLTKAVYCTRELTGVMEWSDFIKSIGLFSDANIVFYNPSSMGMKIEL
jgi:hypothetical protein